MPNEPQYNERHIEKLKQLVELHGEDSPFAEELKHFTHPVGGVSSENVKKDVPEKHQKKKE